MMMPVKLFFDLSLYFFAEPGVLTKPRSQESLSVATEFTKVIFHLEHSTLSLWRYRGLCSSLEREKPLYRKLLYF